MGSTQQIALHGRQRSLHQPPCVEYAFGREFRAQRVRGTIRVSMVKTIAVFGERVD